MERIPSLLVEPFAGGGIVSLTAVMEGLANVASWRNWTTMSLLFGMLLSNTVPNFVNEFCALSQLEKVLMHLRVNFRIIFWTMDFALSY